MRGSSSCRVEKGTQHATGEKGGARRVVWADYTTTTFIRRANGGGKVKKVIVEKGRKVQIRLDGLDCPRQAFILE
jgi:hypothetical protein